MSVPLPDPSLGCLRVALLTLGVEGVALGVERSPALVRTSDPARPWAPPGAWQYPSPVQPRLVALTEVEAVGWTVLAHWVEHGGHPITRVTRPGGASAQGWCVTLAGRTRTCTVATVQDHARVAELAEALFALRRWACPVRPWGLRDLQADSVDRVQREASVLALGPRPAVALDSPIPADYLARYGTAAE